MKAWEFTARGAPASVLSLNPTGAKPALPPHPAEEWILVRVCRAGLNQGSIFHMRLVPAVLRARTAVPEMDLVGRVVDVRTSAEGGGGGGGGADEQAGAPRFRGGDRVVAFLPIGFAYPSGCGALAEFAAFPAKYAVKLPDGGGGAGGGDGDRVRMRDAAGLLLAGCTARQLLRDAGVESRGGRVLVNAASGGIGTLAVQMARQIVGPEGRVVGVCSGRNAELVRGLGADDVVDYTACAGAALLPGRIARRFEGEAPFDAVVDCLGNGGLYGGCAAFLREGGVYASVGIEPSSWSYAGFLAAAWRMQMNAWWPVSPRFGGAGRVWKGTAMMDPGRELMEEVVGMLVEGKIKVVVDSEWEFGKAREAYEFLEKRRARGKVVIVVNEGEDEDGED